MVKSIDLNSDLKYNYQPKPTPSVITSSKMKYKDITLPSGEILGYGVQRLGGAFDGSGKRIWIIDTGISPNTGELNINEGLSKSFVKGENWHDTLGHGTAVAAVAAAKMNGKGIVGMAYGAEVVAIKVFSSGRKGTLLGIIRGLEYTAKHIKNEDSWNMSIAPSLSLDRISASELRLYGAIADAIDDLAELSVGGIAAGNKNINIDTTPFVESFQTPLASPKLIVGAIDSNDIPWEDSNYGSLIDYWAPGVNIITINKDGSLRTEEGTSLAAPLVSALHLKFHIFTRDHVSKGGISAPIPTHN